MPGTFHGALPPRDVLHTWQAPKCIPKCYRYVEGGWNPGNPRINWNLASLKSVSVACLAISGCSENRDDAHDDQWLGSTATSNHKMSKNSPFTRCRFFRDRWILKVDGISYWADQVIKPSSPDCSPSDWAFWGPTWMVSQIQWFSGPKKLNSCDQYIDWQQVISTLVP